MKKMNTPGKLMFGIGLTAAAAAMTPVVKNIINSRNNQMSSGKSSDYNSMH